MSLRDFFAEKVPDLDGIEGRAFGLDLKQLAELIGPSSELLAQAVQGSPVPNRDFESILLKVFTHDRFAVVHQKQRGDRPILSLNLG